MCYIVYMVYRQFKTIQAYCMICSNFFLTLLCGSIAGFVWFFLWSPTADNIL